MCMQAYALKIFTQIEHDAAAAKSCQSCLTVRPHRRQPARYRAY